MSQFTHLHVHTQFSLLDGAAGIEELFQKVKNNGMTSLAITDHGNMFGVLNFVLCAKCYGIKPIIGCETYVAHNSRHDKKTKDDRSGYHLILLAKNHTGYKNLSKLVSLAYKEGHYYKPRVDKELLRQYHEGLIASTACLGGEIPYFILNYGMKKAEERLEEYLDIFKDDFYFELQRLGIEEQQPVNKALLELSAKYGVKVIATNDVHYVNKEDFEAHQVLIQINTKSEEDDDRRLKYTGNEYLKTREEMEELFPDIPEAIANTQDLADKVEEYKLQKDVILPVFPIPENYKTGDDYLRYLSMKGASEKYPEITKELQERIDMELAVITKMGFSGYFLIVQDFINEARKMGVIVGPGRGSATGSVVAYCIGITNIDPIKYNLLFERFMNPERISLPDIDVDFDDEQRDKVLEYVCNKYGHEKVAQIITFGTMGPKMAIRDVARVLNFPLPEADKLAKLIPDKLPEGGEITFRRSYELVPELLKIKEQGSKEVQKVLKLAEILEGSIRHSGTHACGVIIGREDLTEFVPLSTAKDSKLMVTQYEGKNIESIGLLKMDFLGLKTLTIIKDTLDNIRKRHGITIDIDKIPLDDKKTYDLFKKGDTIGIFQFESDGMRAHMKNLKPTNIEDLIAMNALYRPGPMDDIPKFISRKTGREKIEYPHPLTEEILKPTYGVMVYQEQIMQISRKLADFTGAEADELRKAMGKKKREIIEKMKSQFIEGAQRNNISKEKAGEIYESMGKFGQYGFNRSHSAAYSVVAYQTAYLKANYGAEFMAAVLTNNLSDIKKINFYISESQRQKISVLGPDINESELKFSVNNKGEIRFGLAAIKNVGEGVVNEIIKERKANGIFKDIFDLTRRVSIRSLNKKCLEALVLAGAFDSLSNKYRSQYFYKKNPDDLNFIEKIIKNAGNYHNGKLQNQQFLFGEESSDSSMDIEFPECEPWSKYEMLTKEKEVVGFYVTGHPLDDYKCEMSSFCNCDTTKINNNTELRKLNGKEVRFTGIVTSASQKISKNNKQYGSFTIEDYEDSVTLTLFSEDYLKYKHFFIEGEILFVKARVQQRMGMEDNFELKVLHVSLLSEVMAKLTNTVTVFLPLFYIDDEIIKKLNDMILKNKGECRLKLVVTDDSENIKVEMPSKKYKININQFVKSLSENTELEFKLN